MKNSLYNVKMDLDRRSLPKSIFTYLCCLLIAALAACSGPAATQPLPYPAATAAVIETAAVADLLTPSPTDSTASPSSTPHSALRTPTFDLRLPTFTPTFTRPPVTLLPSATPDCQDGLKFLEDATIPDGTIVPPGSAIDKRWKVQNSGGCNWDARYRLKRISGPVLGAPDEMALYPARSSMQAVIRILLTAPAEPGNYRSAWQAADPKGTMFGDPIYVDINVASKTP